MSQPWPQAEATWGRGCAGVREWASWRHWCCRLSPARGPAWRQAGSSESRAGPCGGAKAGVLVAAPFPSPLPAFQGGIEGRLGAQSTVTRARWPALQFLRQGWRGRTVRGSGRRV